MGGTLTVLYGIPADLVSNHAGQSSVREQENPRDCYAVAVLEADTCCVVRHLPYLISHECYFFFPNIAITV